MDVVAVVAVVAAVVDAVGTVDRSSAATPYPELLGVVSAS